MVSIEGSPNTPVIFPINPVLKRFSNISLILNVSVLLFFVMFLLVRHFNNGTPRDFREYIPSQAVSPDGELEDVERDSIDDDHF